jgi:hypothetical protein
VGSVGSFSHFLVYLNTIIFLFYTELKCLLAPLLKTYPCEVEGAEGAKKVIGNSFLSSKQISDW